MRHPLRRAAIWLAFGLPGALMVIGGFAGWPSTGVYAVVLGGIGAPLALFGLAGGAHALHAAFADRRLGRGEGLIARWTVPPADWAAFLEADARYAASQPEVINILDRRPPDGRPVEAIVGARRVLLDGAGHAVGGFGGPEVMDVGWLRAEGVPDCIHLAMRVSRGRSGGYAWLALRIPVPDAAQEDAARVFHHFRDGVPAHADPLVLRRPGLVAAWGFGTWGAASAVALGGWLLDVAPLLTAGLVVAGIARLTTLVLLGAALLRRAFAPTSAPSPPR